MTKTSFLVRVRNMEFQVGGSPVAPYDLRSEEFRVAGRNPAVSFRKVFEQYKDGDILKIIIQKVGGGAIGTTSEKRRPELY